MFLFLYPSMPDHHLTTAVQWCCKISKKRLLHKEKIQVQQPLYG